MRQYVLLALGKIGDESALPALRDVANRPTAPGYVLAAAVRSIELEEVGRFRKVGQKGAETIIATSRALLPHFTVGEVNYVC